MSAAFPVITLVRHGETEWSAAGKHTGRTDIPLTPAGEDAARNLAPRLRDRSFAAVWSSPSQRAFRTSALGGFEAIRDDDLQEWDYGAYEGRTTKDILAEHPGWTVFKDGCPGGESVSDIEARADRVVAQLRATAGDVLVFSSAHFLRVLAARWLGVPARAGAYLVLDTASVSVLGYEHDLEEPVIRRWNVK